MKNGHEHRRAWGHTRGLWKKESPEEAEHDRRRWDDAACEEGGFFSVLWCEFRQLLGDIFPRIAPHAPPSVETDHGGEAPQRLPADT